MGAGWRCAGWRCAGWRGAGWRDFSRPHLRALAVCAEPKSAAGRHRGHRADRAHHLLRTSPRALYRPPQSVPPLAHTHFHCYSRSTGALPNGLASAGVSPNGLVAGGAAAAAASPNGLASGAGAGDSPNGLASGGGASPSAAKGFAGGTAAGVVAASAGLVAASAGERGDEPAAPICGYRCGYRCGYGCGYG